MLGEVVRSSDCRVVVAMSKELSDLKNSCLGRRTFVTAAARNAHKAGCSLRDIQLLAGHRSIEVTQAYIDGDSQAQRWLVALL
jgi:hypothetical protein